MKLLKTSDGFKESKVLFLFLSSFSIPIDDSSNFYIFSPLSLTTTQFRFAANGKMLFSPIFCHEDPLSSDLPSTASVRAHLVLYISRRRRWSLAAAEGGKLLSCSFFFPMSGSTAMQEHNWRLSPHIFISGARSQSGEG